MQDLHADGVDAAADRLWHALYPSYGRAPTSWRDMDSIGRSEFGGAVEQAISAYLETAAAREGRAGELRHALCRIEADITLHSTRTWPAPGLTYGCSSKFRAQDMTSWDCVVSLRDQQLAPGETRRADIDFMERPLAPVFRIVPKFYLWNGEIFAEAVPVSGPMRAERS